MATVTDEVTRVDAADAVGNWDKLDTSTKALLNNDFFYQNTGSISIKATTSVDGSEYEHASTVDYTSPKRVVIFKDLITTIGVLLERGKNDPSSDQLITGGLNNRIGSDQSNFQLYYIHGSDTYPAAGGWQIVPIDPNVTEWVDETTGTPSLTAIDYYAVEGMMSTTVRDDNVAIDAVDYLTSGTGLTITGTSSVFQDFIDYDEGTIANRYGLISSRSGVLYCAGTLTIGNSTLTAFADSNKVIVFEPGLTDAGHTGLVLGLGNASNNTDLTDNTIVGTGASGSKHYIDNISSVDAANNEIDITSHGWETGNPVLYSDEGGSNAIGGLTDATAYYVIKVTDDAIALSDGRWAAQKGDVRLVLADASSFTYGTEIAGDGDGGNDGEGIVVGVTSNDVTVYTLTGSWVSGNGVDNQIPYSSDDTTISSIESTNGGIGLSDGASRENHSLARQPDTRPDISVTISMTVASATNFVVGGPITGDGDSGNDGVGIVRGISGSVLEVQTLSGSWVATNGVDNADPYSADDTTITSFVASGDADLIGGSILNARRISSYTGVDISSNIVGIGKILLNGGTLTDSNISGQSTEEGEGLTVTDDLDLITGCSFTAEQYGHAIEMMAATSENWDNSLSGYWVPADTGWNFSTAQAFTSENLNTDAAHGFTAGDAVYYNKEGGTAAIGLTDDTKYYVDVIDTDTVTVHLTRASAIASTAAINLTTNGSETHSLYSANAAVYNSTSSGTLTIGVTAGDPPSFRNAVGATTVVTNAVPAGVSGVTEGTSITIIANETVGSITEGDVIASGFADSTGEYEITDFNYEGAFDPSGLDVITSARNQGVAVAAIAEDTPAFTDETEEASSNTTADMTLLPAVPIVNDAYYLAHNEQFSRLKLTVSTVLTFSVQPTITWEYWNGAWVSLSGVSDGTSGFETLGQGLVTFTLPGDWATTTVNSQGPLYYVRARLSTAGTITQVPIGSNAVLDVTRYLPYTAERVIVSGTGLSDIASWQEDTISKFVDTD
jgi:hypothetical protein